MRKILLFILAFFVAGCSFRPSMPEVNATFNASFESTQISDKWWQEFKDDKLNLLIDEALKKNLDLKLAYYNLEQARLNLANSKADLVPNLGLNAEAAKTQSSGETHTSPAQVRFNNFSLSAVLNYEIDLWGRVRNTIASKDALLNASKFDYESARLSIISAVAKSYFSLVALKMQEAVYIDSLQSYTETMNYRKRQLDAGSVTNMVYMQSVAEVQNAQINLQTIQNSIVLASNALSILTGKSNDEILYKLVDTASVLPNAPQINANISSDILLRRPDVAAKFEVLKSSNALVGVARAAYFPTLSLTGIFGFSSDELNRLFINNANTWSLGASLAQNLFDYGRRSNNVELAKLAQSADALNYEKAVKTALGEVKTALASRQNAIQITEQSDKLLSTQNEIYRLANAQYDAGYVDHLTLLDAQRVLLSTRLNKINAELNLNNSVLEIYKAFGGGFKNTK
ncbi:MAG: efflux transporter outer membrane subunit [Campylobacter sp.]|nr:efflux transporter outer membrane subunit [Campylobacter sp.]